MSDMTISELATDIQSTLAEYLEWEKSFAHSQFQGIEIYLDKIGFTNTAENFRYVRMNTALHNEASKTTSQLDELAESAQNFPGEDAAKLRMLALEQKDNIKDLLWTPPPSKHPSFKPSLTQRAIQYIAQKRAERMYAGEQE